MEKLRQLIVSRTVFSIVLFLCICYVNTYSQEKTVSNFKAISPVDAVKKMNPGWNLGNTLDATPTESSWGNPPIEKYTFDDIKNSGFKSIRLPVTWTDHIGPAPDYKVDPKWMDRVEQVVDWALAKDFYAIIDIHHDSWTWVSKMAIDPETGKYVNDYDNQIIKLEKLWEQIAERFKNKNEKLILEIINEPNNGDWEGVKIEKPTDPNNPETLHDLTHKQMDDLTNRILKIIRLSGGYNDKRLVMVCGLLNDSEKTLESFKAPHDKYIILSVHYYAPWDFVSNGWGKITWGTSKDKEYPDRIFKQLYEKFVKNDLPIVVGEWGTLAKSDTLSKWYYHDYIAKTAYKYGMTCMWWDNGEHFDRKNRVWRDETIKNISVNAGLGIPNSFVIPLDNYFQINTNVYDLKVKLELNGNQLVGIYNEEYNLINGVDYTLDTKHSTVTIKQNYLKKLLKSGKLGLSATLKFDFSQGVDLPMYIIQYDLPKLAEDSITVDKSKGEIKSDMRILVSFNGTKLATVKVVDKTNKKPVVEKDTPYLKMHDHFDYDETGIILKKTVLNSLKADSLITLEFWPRDIKIEIKINVLNKPIEQEKGDK